MPLQSLPYDCQCEITRHLTIQTWSKYRSTSTNSQYITDITPYKTLYSVIDIDWGSIKIKDKLFKCHYLGEYITHNNKTIRNGFGIYTKKNRS